MPRQPPPERESRRRPREPLIAWRNRHDPDGLRPFDRETGRNGTLVGVTGLAITRNWFFGLMKFREEHPRDATAPLPEMIVVATGREGRRMLQQTRNLDHVSIYWPGRGEAYLCGRPIGRVTIDGEAAPRLSAEERETLRCRTLTFGDRAVWLEL